MIVLINLDTLHSRLWVIILRSAFLLLSYEIKGAICEIKRYTAFMYVVLCICPDTHIYTAFIYKYEGLVQSDCLEKWKYTVLLWNMSDCRGTQLSYGIIGNEKCKFCDFVWLCWVEQIYCFVMGKDWLCSELQMYVWVIVLRHIELSFLWDYEWLSLDKQTCYGTFSGCT